MFFREKNCRTFSQLLSSPMLLLSKFFANTTPIKHVTNIKANGRLRWTNGPIIDKFFRRDKRDFSPYQPVCAKFRASLTDRWKIEVMCSHRLHSESAEIGLAFRLFTRLPGLARSTRTDGPGARACSLPAQKIFEQAGAMLP